MYLMSKVSAWYVQVLATMTVSVSFTVLGVSWQTWRTLVTAGFPLGQELTTLVASPLVPKPAFAVRPPCAMNAGLKGDGVQLEFEPGPPPPLCQPMTLTFSQLSSLSLNCTD